MRIEAIPGTGNRVIMPSNFSLDGRRVDGVVNFPMIQSRVGFSDEIARDFGIDVFHRYTTKETAGILSQSLPTDENIRGVIMPIHTIIDGRPHILIHREKLTNSKVDKKENDYSVTAETRRSGELLLATATRGIEEETGIDPRNLRISPPFGYYAIPGEGEFVKNRTWVQARAAFVDYQVLAEQILQSRDSETDSHCLVHPLYFLGVYPVRAGMLSIVSHWLKGWNNIVAEGSPARRDTEVVYQLNG